MLRLRNHLLSVVRAASPLTAAAAAAAAASSSDRLHLSTAAASSAPFVAEEFLVTACGLTPTQAVRASKYLAHVKSATKPEAVLAFLADMGLAKADVAAAIARKPPLLCSKVDKTLAPRIAQLRDLGLSSPQISSIIAIAPSILRSASMICHVEFYLSFLGSYEKLHTALSRNLFLLSQNVELVVKPNMAFLRRCGLTDSDIARLIVIVPNMLSLSPERMKEIVESADKLGVPCGSAMFKRALVVSYNYKNSQSRIDAKRAFLEEALGCSEAEVGIAISKSPGILSLSELKLGRSVEFLKMEVGLDAAYIVHRPAVLTYSLKRRLIPRHYVLKFLKKKGLLKKEVDFYGAVSQIEKIFVKRFIDPYKKSAPGLADTYSGASAGQFPPEIQL